MAMEWGAHYSNVDTNATLANLYQVNAESLGVKYDHSLPKGSHGSTDMGNVSHVVPAFHILYSIDTKAVNHSHAFTTTAITESAHKKTLIASKAMAMTAIDVMCNPDLMGQIKKDFEKSHPTTD